jgi:hypothetical protein
MWKKVILGTLFVGLIGVLITGAIIRTMDKTAQSSGEHQQGQGQGRGNSGNVTVANTSGQGQSNGNGGHGRGQAASEDQTGQATVEEWVTLQGAVQDSGEDALTIQLDNGEQLVVEGRPWSFAQEEAFTAETGDQITLNGFYEDDMFEVGQIENITGAQTVLLRDETGRPMWAGGGQRSETATATSASNQSNGQGQGNGNGSAGNNGNRGGNQGGAGSGNESGADNEASPDAEAWLTLTGTALSVDDAALTLTLADGDEMIVEGRAWSFTGEQTFTVQAGDQVILTGFYEDDEFKPVQLENTTTGQTVLLRDETGRPMWAGGSQGRSR